MHRIVSTSLMSSALFLALGSAQATTLADLEKQGFVRAATANEVPYGFTKEDGSAAGIGPEVAEAVFKSMGVNEVAWTVTPFGTLIPGLKARRFDLTAAEQNIQPDRCRQVAFSEPNSSYGEGLLVKKGNPKNLHTYADIAKDSKLKVAVVSGANNIDYLRAVGVKEEQVVYIKDNADAPATVQSRVDAYAATELTVFNLAQKQPNVVERAEPFTDPVVDGKPVRNYGGFAFRLDDAELLQAFNKALVAFRQTDDYKAILSRYGLSEASIQATAEVKIDDLCAGH